MSFLGSLPNGIACFCLIIVLQGVLFAGAPILSGVNPTLTPSISIGDANPPGYTVSTFLNPIVTDGTLLDDFESNTAVSKWGGTWLTFNDAGGGGLSVVTPPVLTFTASAPGYNSAYCAKVTAALHQGLIVGYNPYVGLTVSLNPTATLPVDLTKATGFWYWFKGGKHYFRMETSDINAGAASYYQDSVPASATWKQVIFTWDSLHSVNYGSGVVSPVSAASKKLAMRLSWAIQGPDGTVDSVLVDNVEVTGFADRGIAVTGADNTNGAWQFSTDAGTNWTPFGALSDNSGTLLNAAAQVRFVPAAAYSGPSTFIFRAWNQTDGKANGSAGQIVVPNGTVTPYSAVSATGTVQVVQDINAPLITVQPVSQTKSVGQPETLSVVVTGNPSPTYQWRKNGANITGATNASYIIASVALTDAGTFDVVVTNSQGSITSTVATLTVNSALTPPTISTQPASQTKFVGQADTFTVVAAGNPAPTYQWRKNGVAITGATNASYIIASVALTDAGTYDVVVTNSQGSVTSAVAVLIVSALIKASFTVSDSIATAPASIQFTDHSTGAFTKRMWYFGDGTVDSSNIQNPQHVYTAPAIYIAKLVLLNGALRADSCLVSFTIINSNPALVPVIIPYQPKVTQERRPLLCWHPVSGASTYTFVIDDNADFSSPISSFPLSDTSYKLLADLPFGAIYWKVKSNLIDVWSSVDKFTVVPDTIPDLIRYNGEAVSTKRPIFAWHPVTNALDYLIQIANNSGFTSAMSLKVSDTSFVPLADLANGTWYWEVSCSRNYTLFAPYDSLIIGSTGNRGAKLPGAVKPFVSIRKTAKGFSIATAGYETGTVRAELYSVRGELAYLFTNAGSGQTTVAWNGRDRFGKNCGNGVYILRVRVQGKVMTDKIIIQR